MNKRIVAFIRFKYIVPFYFQISNQSIYLDFLNLRDYSHEGIIKFFERNKEEINQLGFAEYLELYTSYLNSLFQVGQYHKFLENCDWLIEKSIEENIQTFHGVDIYCQTIFRKSASLYNVDKPYESFKIATELIKMQPEEETYKLLARKCYLKEKYGDRVNIKFAGVCVLLVCSLVFGYEAFGVNYFKMAEIEFLSIIRNILFCIGLLIVSGSELFYHLMARIKANNIY